MSAWTAPFLLTNAGSGLVLIACAALAAGRPYRHVPVALPLFFASWGTQVALTNIASTADAQWVAHALYLVSNASLPLQAFWLLGYAQEEVRSRRLRRVAQGAAVLVAALLVVGVVLAVILPHEVLNVHRGSDGNFDADGAWGQELFFDMPRLLGIGLAVVLLAFTTEPDDPGNWRLNAGLTAALAWSIGYSFGSNLRHHYDDAILSGGMGLAVALLGVSVVVLVVRAHHAYEGRLPAYIALLACAAGPVAEWPSDGLWFALSPGVWRLIFAATLIIPALFYRDWLTHYPSNRRWPFLIILVLAAATMALGSFGVLGFALPNFWQAATTSLGAGAVAATLMVGSIPFLDVLRNALPRAWSPGRTDDLEAAAVPPRKPGPEFA